VRLARRSRRSRERGRNAVSTTGFEYQIVPVVPIRAAGAVIFCRTERGVRVLVLRAQAKWDLPQGPIAPGEDALDAVTRDVAAETGLADLDFPFGESHMEALPSADGKAVSYYIAETEEAEIQPRTSPGRGAAGEAWRWVSFDEAEDLLPPRLALIMDWARAAIA